MVLNRFVLSLATVGIGAAAMPATADWRLRFS